MSAPVSRDPLVVNTQDGCCWTRRAVTREGRGLYALADVKGDVPELVLSTLRELAEHGLASMADALPVPVGSPDALRLEDPFRPCGCPKRFDRHADGCPTLPEGEHYPSVHHTYRVPRELPPLGGAQ